MINFINEFLTQIIGLDFGLLTINEITSRVSDVQEWQRLFFDFNLITSLIVYFALFYLIYYVLMYLPFKLFKRLVGQK